MINNLTKIIFIIFVFCLYAIIPIKNVSAEPSGSYVKTGSVTLSPGAGKCQGPNLVDNRAPEPPEQCNDSSCKSFIEACISPAICTLVANEWGCFTQIQTAPVAPEPVAPSPVQQPEISTTPAPVSRPPGLAAPLPVCTRDFLRDECVGCNKSRPVYTNSCTGAYSWDPDQEDKACAHYSCNEPTTAPAPISGGNPNPPTNDSPSAPVAPVTVKYRVATSEFNLNKAEWRTYESGGVIVPAPSDIYSIDKTTGTPNFISSENCW